MKMNFWMFLLLLLAFVTKGNTDKCLKPVPKGNVVLTNTALLQNNFPDGSTVSLECAVGYVVDQGSNNITCVNGEWSDQELTCKKKDCGPPSPTPHMKFHIPNGTLFGAHIRPYCERGYYLRGSSYKQCLATGWTGRSICLLVTCGNPPEIPNSVVDSHQTKVIIEFEDVIDYRCKEGYTLVGNRSVVCQENGKYSSLPQCKDKCLKPVPKGNVVLTNTALLQNNFPDGSTVSLECAVGYVVDQGSNNITCVNAEWSDQELTCKMVTCGNPPEIPHSVIDSNHTKLIMEFEDVTEYRCKEGYTLVGNGSVVCQENGKYSSLPQCKVSHNEETTYGNETALYLVLGVCIACIACLIFVFLAYKGFQRQKGSYNTKEGMWTNETLMPNDSFSYKNQQNL